MNDRIDVGAQAGSQPGMPNVPTSTEGVSRTLNLPIASALPAWDLLPGDTLLVRRKPTKP